MSRRWEVFPKYGKGARGGALLNSQKTHCKRGHPLSGENLYVKPDGERKCRICKRAQAATTEQPTEVKEGDDG